MRSAPRPPSTAATSSISRTSATSPARSKTSSWTSSRACTASARSASPSTLAIRGSSGASRRATSARPRTSRSPEDEQLDRLVDRPGAPGRAAVRLEGGEPSRERVVRDRLERRDRKSTRLNSSHSQISYAVFCLKKKKHERVEPSAQHRVADRLVGLATDDGG